MDIQGFRKDYKKPILSRENLAVGPIAQFEQWFKEACDADVLEPNAMTLSTVNSEGQPSSRTVLLKFFDQHGFVFYTNYKSRKAHELAENNRVALLFPWIKLARQVAITGVARKDRRCRVGPLFFLQATGKPVGSLDIPSELRTVITADADA